MQFLKPSILLKKKQLKLHLRHDLLKGPSNLQPPLPSESIGSFWYDTNRMKEEGTVQQGQTSDDDMDTWPTEQISNSQVGVKTEAHRGHELM